MALTELFGLPLDGKRTIVVAELGIQHAHYQPEQRLARAMALIDRAARIGVDAAKFQLFLPDEPLFCPLPGDENRWPRWNQSLMRSDEWGKLCDHAFSSDIPLFFSVFQHGGAELARTLNPPAWKVASRAAENFPYHLTPGPWIVSDGFGHAARAPIDAIRLQCCPVYPSPLGQSWWRGNSDGISDHSGTPWPAIAAIIAGAKLVELHLRHAPGPDFAASLNPAGFRLVLKCRDEIAALRAR